MTASLRVRSSALPRSVRTAVLGLLLLTAASIPEAQAAPTTEGARGWRSDNCFYIYQGGAWRSADICRVIRGAAVYDTFTPSTGRWGLRFNESEPGWTWILDLNGDNPNAWLKFSADGRTILAWDGRQWFNFTAAVAAQNQAQANAQATYARINSIPALAPPTAAEQERERYYEEQRVKKFYENKKHEEIRLAKWHAERAREKIRQDRVANERAAANRDAQRAAANQAAANRAGQQAAANQAAANRAGQQAAANQAAANRAAERAAADRAAANRAADRAAADRAAAARRR